MILWIVSGMVRAGSCARQMTMAETELWFVDLEKSGPALEALEAETPRLPESDHVRFAAMTDMAARRERRLTHIALRILLERRCGPDIRRAPFAVSTSGKPALASGGVSFSLAHTRACALIALADDGPLGVDLERARAVRMPAARRAPIERAAVAMAAGAPLAGDDADSRFLNAWVRIEAVAKAEGTGVGPMLERLRPGRPQDAPAPSRGGEPRIVVAHDIAIGNGLFAAIALARGRAPPGVRHLPDTPAAIATP